MPSRYCEKHSTGSAAIKATVAYTSNGAFVNQATDQDGKVITYAYNQNTGTLTSATDSSGTVTYSYQADNNVGLSMKCYRLGKEKRTYLGERQFKGRIGK